MVSVIKSKIANIIKAADEGDAKAQFLLSMFYQKGFLVDYDEEKWLYYLRKAAEQDLPIACLAMGTLYEDRKFEEADPEMAKQWYKKAADLGVTEAMRSLAFLIIEGEEPDYEEFLKLLEKAAENGNGYAAYDLGTSLAIGFCSDTDYTRAREYFEMAAQNGVGSAFTILESCTLTATALNVITKRREKTF